MKKISIYVTAFMTMLLLAACMNNDNNASDKADNAPVENMSTNDQKADNNTDNADQNLDLAENAADRVEELEEVDGATVLVTDHTAYAAIDLKNGTEVSDDLKNKIQEKVKEADTSVEKVYVSEDPDFTTQLKDYADRIKAGEPVEGFFDEFSDAVRRVFPSS
ncbi:YhcN/YlaJ family sporulation lipoprotein [Domibacillus tundrae]|uniref:YhcN/YlaJ family sporulation lipoprotein n=1 Tax=Domibacillus tundrae TaxID=1587527 RepID=UPI0006181BAB|nr:YhcN/YlaJ family sporulation lipoprotein [Domibacillus tundrae]